MTPRTIIGMTARRMPCKGELGSLNYTIVLVGEEGDTAVARIGAGTEPRWVADNGTRLPVEEARIYFPDLDGVLRQIACSYAEQADG